MLLATIVSAECSTEMNIFNIFFSWLLLFGIHLFFDTYFHLNINSLSFQLLPESLMGLALRQCCKNTFEFVQIALFLAHYTINEWRLYRFYRLYRLYSCSAWYDDSKRQLWIHNVHCSCWYQKWYPNPIQTIWSVKRKITHIRYNSSNQRIEQFYLIC